VEYRQKVFLPIMILFICMSQIWFRIGRIYHSIYSLTSEELKQKEERNEVTTRPMSKSEKKIVQQCADEAKTIVEKLSNRPPVCRCFFVLCAYFHVIRRTTAL
jgi:hypothetical protein